MAGTQDVSNHKTGPNKQFIEVGSRPLRLKNRVAQILKTVMVLAMTGMFFFGSAIVGADLLHAASEKKSSENSDAPPAAPYRFQKLIGNWLRPDGGYILEIRNVDTEGNMDARYFNPRPINISKALAGQDKGNIKLFVELTDVGYPGATYLLTYSPAEDMLAGVYHQPAANQSFEVVFIRKR